MLKPILLLSVAAIAFAGCTPTPPDNAGDGVLRVVASTNVYGAIAQEIGGDRVEVTSIIDDPAQDPHQFEANGRVQLALSRADVVIVNGGGYDDFATQQLAAAGNEIAIVIDAVELSDHDVTTDGFNEHVWYDYPTMQTVVKAIAAGLGAVDPEGADAYDTQGALLGAGLQALELREQALAPLASGLGVVITEPVPLYLLEASGFTNLTPLEFSEAIEEDTDVPPALLQTVLNEIGDGSAALVVYNEQTGGPQTDAILDIASENGVPALGVTETLPAGQDYLGWQGGYLDLIQRAVTG